MNGTGTRALAIYLNDLLAGATGGVALARRPAESQRDPQAATQLRGLAGRQGRLKLNGRLLGRSPLSALIELEMLRLGIEGKAAGWQTLRILAASPGSTATGHLDELIARARDQSQLVENLRLQASADVLVEPPAV